MKNYPIEIACVRRTLPFVDISDELAYASFVIISDVELVNAVSRLLAERITDCDIIVTAEAKGISLAYAVSRLLGFKEFVVARKSVKSYMRDPLSVPVRSITTFDEQRLYLDAADINKLKGRRVCLLDDVVSTGESLAALAALVELAGGEVKARACVLAEGEAADREDLIYLDVLPLFQKVAQGEYEVMK